MRKKSKIRDLLKRPISYHAAFAKEWGATAAILLSQALYWQEIIGDGREWYKSYAEWQKETGLTVEEFKSARARLVKAGVLRCERKGMPARCWYMVDIDALIAHFSAGSSSRESHHQVRGIPTIKMAGKPPSSSRDSHNQDGGKATIKFAGKPPSLITEINTEINRDYSIEALRDHLHSAPHSADLQPAASVLTNKYKSLTPEHEHALQEFEQCFGFTPLHETPMHWAYITACLSGDTRHLERLKGVEHAG